MKKFKENIKKAVMLVMAILMINSSVFADNWVTNCGNYKNGDYRATQIVAGNNVKATKSASWVDADKTTAKVRIELETKGVTDTVGNLKNCDIIFVCDKSRSAYNSIASAYSDCPSFETGYVKEAATRFITGDFKDSGNRVLFMDFAESAFLYKNGKSLRNYGYYYSTYSSSTARSEYKDLYRGTKNASKTLDNLKSRNDKLNSVYDTIYSTLYNMIKSDIGSKETDSLFTSDATELSKNIDKAASTTAYRDPVKGNIADSENKQIYTNIDAPLFMANILLDKRNDNSRKAYIIFFSDGVPDPIGTPKVSAGQYSMDVEWGTLAQDGAKTFDTTRNDGVFSKDRSYLVKNPYPVNYFYKKIADEIGTTGANKNTEIFLIKTGKDTAVENSSYKTISGKGSSIYPIWNYITRGIKTSYSKDSSYPTYPNVPVPDYGLEGSPLSGSYDSNTTYIKVISNTSSSASTKSAIDSALVNIQNYLMGDTSNEKKALNLTVNDVINYNDFDIVPNSWKSNVNQSSIKYNSSTKTISWPVNGIKYGEKCADGNWPYIEFQVKIKDASKNGYVNTNYIGNNDDGCKITGDENIIVPSPWLKRDVGYTVTEEYYKDGVIDNTLTNKTSNILPNTTYTPEIKTIPEYKHTSSTQTDAFKVTGDVVIKHYYTSVYTVTIKYINDETKGTMQNDIVVKDILKGTTWPADKTIANKYMVTDTKGQWNKGAYEIVTNNVKVDGKKYTTTTIPNNILINGNKVIEFHYKLKDGEYKVRLWIATYIIDQFNNEKVLLNGVEPTTIGTVKYETDKSVKYTNPDTVEAIKGGKYIGNRVTYKKTNPTMTSADIVNLKTDESAKIKITEDNIPCTIDFVYKKAQYSLTVNYLEEGTNKVLRPAEIIQGIPEGGTTGITIPEKIEETGVADRPADQYIYQSRDDGKDINAETNPITQTTVINVYYKKQVKIIAEYVNARTNNKITEVEKNPNESEYADPPLTKTWEENLNPHLPEEYKFFSRTGDGKTAQEDPIVATEHSVKVTYKYLTLGKPGPNPPEDYPNYEPVVCYPKINGSSEQATVMAGDSITITIPNYGTHDQMYRLGFEEPENGWNAEYGVTKFVQFPFDVYYDGKLYLANEKIVVAVRKNDSLSNAPITFVIPEWVEEKDGYVVKAYTSSSGKAVPMNARNNYNTLLEENAAIGEVKVNVKGKIYDFTITNLIEDRMWPTSLFKDKVAYKALSAVNGNVGMLPIGQKSQQPDKYNYGIALGSTFFFRVSTLGIKNKSIKIEPQFTYVSADGATITRDIKLWSVEKNKYVEFSGSNLKLQTQVNNQYKQQRTDWVNEAKLRESIDPNYKAMLSSKEELGKFSRLQLNNVLKTPYKAYYEEKYNETLLAEVKSKGKAKDLYDAVSNWYGEYRLPSSTIVMPSGKDPNQSRTDELKGGYIIVSFRINSNYENNNTYLQYENQHVGNQWKNERNNLTIDSMSITLPTIIGQSENVTKTVSFSNGFYPVAIYEVGNRITSNNYEVGGTH